MTSLTNNILVIGLGNIGEEYKKTRHNVGFLFLDFLQKDSSAGFDEDKYSHSFVSTKDNIVFAKPTTMMNSSGKAALALLKKHSVALDNVYVVHDDLDLRLGEYKVQKGVGPKLHNGISSIQESLGTSDFWRIRIGVDNRDPVHRTPGETYVLERFLDAELLVLNDIFTKIANEKNFLTP